MTAADHGSEIEHRFSTVQTAIYRQGFAQAVERVGLRIAWRQGEGWCFLTVEQISSDCAVSLATAKRALAFLEQQGWMEVCAGERTGKNGRPTKGRRIVIPTRARPEDEPAPKGVTAQCDEPKPPGQSIGTDCVSAHGVEPKVPEVSAHGVEPKGGFSAHGPEEGFGSSGGGVSAHLEGGFGSPMDEPPQIQINSQLPDARAREAEPKPDEPKPPGSAPDASCSPAPTTVGSEHVSREGWRERALQSLWSGWTSRYRARFHGSRPPHAHLDDLRGAAEWILRRLANQPGMPEGLAEQLLTGFWLRKDIRPRTPARWLSENPERYLRAAEEAAVEAVRESRRDAAYADERRRFAAKSQADDAVRNDVSRDEWQAFTDKLRGGPRADRRVDLPTPLAALRADHRGVIERVEEHLPPNLLDLLDLRLGEVWAGRCPGPDVFEALHSKGLDLRPLRSDEGKGWLVVRFENRGAVGS